MDLQDYFDNTEGSGVLATADGKGRVDAALYARPHFLDGRHASFIMSDRLSHRNLQANPRAVYLFHAKGPGWEGKRLMLRKVGEKSGEARIPVLRRRSCPVRRIGARSFLVTFKVEEVRPLVGA